MGRNVTGKNVTLGEMLHRGKCYRGKCYRGICYRVKCVRGKRYTSGCMGFGHIFQLTSACNFIVFLITWNYSLQIVLFNISSPVLQAEVATCWPKVSHWKIIKTFFNEALPKRRYFPSRHQNH